MCVRFWPAWPRTLVQAHVLSRTVLAALHDNVQAEEESWDLRVRTGTSTTPAAVA